MENEITESGTAIKESPYLMPIAAVIAAGTIAGAWIYSSQNPSNEIVGALSPEYQSAIAEAVLPPEGVELPIVWEDLGARLVEAGAIDAERFRQMYASRGEWNGEYENLLLGQKNGHLIINEENAGYILNLLWAFGLANKNPILDSGEMMNPAYSKAEPPAGGFASTAGWTLAKGSAMEHYSAHALVTLTPAQQRIVDQVSRNIFRPCCGNSTHFPDCNHGMAMLGLLELLASQGASEEQMYKTALAVNSYWFPDTYLTIAEYMRARGIDWKDVSPKEALGANYSSASGYARIQALVPRNAKSGSSCGA